MNRALRIIFSRYGIIVIILVLVLGAIALANKREQTPLDGTDSGTEDPIGDSTSEGFTQDDGFATDDCEGDDCFAAEELPQEAIDRSVEFTEVWLNPNGYGPDAWYDAVVPFVTSEQADLLQGVDPISVPAESITGDPAAEGPKVSIPLDTGTLTLTMTEGSNNWTEHDWLVSAIDWEQS